MHRRTHYAQRSYYRIGFLLIDQFLHFRLDTSKELMTSNGQMDQEVVQLRLRLNMCNVLLLIKRNGKVHLPFVMVPSVVVEKCCVFLSSSNTIVGSVGLFFGLNAQKIIFNCLDFRCNNHRYKCFFWFCFAYYLVSMFCLISIHYNAISMIQL